MPDLPAISFLLSGEGDAGWGPTDHESDPELQRFVGMPFSFRNRRDHLPRVIDWLGPDRAKKDRMFVVDGEAVGFKTTESEKQIHKQPVRHKKVESDYGAVQQRERQRLEQQFEKMNSKLKKCIQKERNCAIKRMRR